MYTIYLITNKVNNKKYVGITSKSVEVRSEEFKKHQSEIRIGKKFTEEHKRKLSKNNGASRVVYQYTLDNVFISEYPSCNEAERRTGVKAYNIRSCCYGKQHTAGGFIWKYK